jgi:peptide chain release factor 1
MNKEKLKKILNRYDELVLQLQNPEIIANQSEFTRLAREKSSLQEVADLINHYFDIKKNIEESNEILENADLDLQEMAREEITALTIEEEKIQSDLQIALLPKDPNDEKNVIIEIRPGAGGDESELFAAEMFRMYTRYAERQSWKANILESQATAIGGMKYVTFEISGSKVYSKMKYESGVHRVQRVPETEKQGRVHTSTTTVAVMPEAEEADVDIKTEDLRIDTFCSGGAGGQSVNTTYSAVRITHLPTNTVVQCQDERSQLKNKEKAMSILRSRILANLEEKLHNERKDLRSSQVGTGDRSEKIRTYNFPQDRLTDHRINQSWHSLPNIMDGDLDSIFESLMNEDQARKLAMHS